LSPRICRIVAVPAPNERERTQWYFQRYVAQLPSAGELVLMDRSWYNRAGVEHVMGYCTSTEYHRFLNQCPDFERLLIDDGIILLKYWFSVSEAEQERRFQSRVNDPLRRWKLSEVDLEARQRWSDYSRAKDVMFARTDTSESPWYVVDAEDKRAARINCIAHLLSQVPFQQVDEGRAHPRRHLRVGLGVHRTGHDHPEQPADGDSGKGSRHHQTHRRHPNRRHWPLCRFWQSR
jgi:polyphosphate kinase 2